MKQIAVLLTLLSVFLVAGPVSAKGKTPKKGAEAAKSKVPDAEKIRVEAERLIRKRQYRKAIPKYKEVLQLKPYDYPVIYYNLGEISAKVLEDCTEAILFYNRYLALDPETPDKKSVQRAVRECKKRQKGAKPVTIRVEGPKDPLVILNGIPISDNASTALSLTPGTYSLRVDADDFFSSETSFEIGEKGENIIPVTLKPVPYYGKIVVKVNVDGAQVSIAGEALGESPVKEHKVLAGKHLVEVKKDGYHRWIRNVVVGKDEEYLVEVKMGKIKQ